LKRLVFCFSSVALFEKVQFEEDWFFTPLQGGNSVLKRPKSAPLQMGKKAVEENQNPVSRGHSIRVVFGQYGLPLFSLAFFEGV
jgi:hypothetical protein